MELLQFATAQFITKCDGRLLQIATAFLLQSATRFITNCDRYCKARWIYYKFRQVLQSAMIITNCDSTYALNVDIYGTLIFQRRRMICIAAMLEGILLPSNMATKTTFCLCLVKSFIVTLRCAVNVTTSSFQHFP